MEELIRWREAHPLATFAEIERELDERLADARAQMLGDLAVKTPARKATGAVCPECGKAMRSDGSRTRAIRTRQGRRVRLAREYAICPGCGAGLLPHG